MASSRVLTVLVNACLFGAGGFLVAFSTENDVFSGRISYAVLTLVLLAYLLLEVLRIRRVHSICWMSNPVVVSAIMTFFMGYGLTNIIFFLPADWIEFLGLLPEVSTGMVKHQFLVLLGAVSMVIGYWSPLAVWLTTPQKVTEFQNRFLPNSDKLRVVAIPSIVGIAIVIRLYTISQGLYGYGGDYSAERVAVTADYSQFLSLAGGLGKLSLVLAALQYFTRGARPKDASWFWITLVIEISFGLFSGLKSGIAIPIIIAGICFYLQTGQWPKKWVALSLASIVFAYAIVEPFRDLRNKEGSTLTSVSSIVDVFFRGQSDYSVNPSKKEDENVLLAFAARNNLSYIGAFGIDFADSHDELPPGSPDFLVDIFLAPFHALIPRFVWSSKPLGNLGTWYTQSVMGINSRTSIAMGPFTYLYLAGGYLPVALAFFALGVMQRTLFIFTSPWRFQAGAVVYLVLLPTVAIVDSSVNGIIINLVRDIPLILIVVYFMFRGNSFKVEVHSPKARSQ